MTSGLAALRALRAPGRLPSDAEAARAAGRELAREVCQPRSVPASTALTVEAMVRAGLPRLAEVGVQAEVVRARPNCVVVRSLTSDGAEALHGCVFVSAWLESLPQLAHQVPGTVVEPSCRTRGAESCIHTLLWQEPEGAVPAPTPARAKRPVVPAGGPSTLPVPTPAPETRGVRAPVPRVTPVLPTPTHVTPAPVTTAAPTPAPVTTAAPTPAPVTPGAPRQHRGRHTRAWLRRRSWVLALGLVAGSAAGAVLPGHGAPSYSATAVLVVRSGASHSGPGGANEAEALAITDAAVMPQDKTVVGQIARMLRVPPSEVSSSLSVQAQAGTALVEVQYTAHSAAGAIAGANAVANVASGIGSNDQAIASGSLAVVSRAATASPSGSVLYTWLPVGALLGLVAGVIAARVIEHTDQRIDEDWSLGEVSGGPVTVVPSGTSPAELAVMLDRAGGGHPYALVPLRVAQVEPAGQLARELHGTGTLSTVGRGGRTVPVTAPFADAPDVVCRGEGATVLVVGGGERRRVVAEAVQRLAHVDRGPLWSVLVTARSPRSPAEERADHRSVVRARRHLPEGKAPKWRS